MRTLSRKFFAIGLLLALLVCSTGRAIPVSALAQPDWSLSAEYAPIFDTEIVNIEDYMGSHLTTPQYDVFWTLLGVYVLAQGGAEEYKLRNPYANEDGVVNWLKDCGIQLWNSMVGLNMTPYDPVTGVDWKVLAKKAQDVAMGAAIKASSYEDLDDFLDDVETKDKYLVPFMPDVQTALHYIFQRDGSLYDWQFDIGEFVSTVQYEQIVIPPTSNYWALLETFHTPLVRCNWTLGDRYLSNKNTILNHNFFDVYHNLFLDTSNGRYYFVDDNGNKPNNSDNILLHDVRLLTCYVPQTTGSVSLWDFYFYFSGTYPTLDSYQDIIQYLVDTPTLFVPYDGYDIFINDFVNHYYYGSSWANKHEIFHSTDLNLDVNSIPYYLQTQTDYLIDIKGIIQDLVLPTINLKDVFLNNLFDLTGVVVTDPVLTQIAKDILYEIQTQNIPLPVNLNDIADYTDNSYLDRVKEEAQRGGNTLAALVAFWHNCDAELIYVLFGAGITVLVGAFIGKWGHS